MSSRALETHIIFITAKIWPFFPLKVMFVLYQEGQRKVKEEAMFDLV